MKFGSLLTAFGAFVSHVATAADAAIINGELNKVLPLADQYELDGIQISASGRIGGVRIEGGYKLTFDDQGTIALGGALGETFPDELRAPVQEAFGKFAKSLRPVDFGAASDGSPWVGESATTETPIEVDTPVETPEQPSSPGFEFNSPLNKGLTLGDLLPGFKGWNRQ